MNNKQLAEMVKRFRKKKLEEIIGKPPPFNPAHHKATHGEDPESPNQAAHKMSEEILNELGGTYHKRKTSLYKQTLGALRKRRSWQVDAGQQKMKGRYTEEEIENLGNTDTGKKSKSDTETVDINPNIPTAKGETTKNSNIKEIKEK